MSSRLNKIPEDDTQGRSLAYTHSYMCEYTPQHTEYMHMHAYIKIQTKKANHIDALAFGEDLLPIALQYFRQSQEIPSLG